MRIGLYRLAVLALWLAAVGWLVIHRILPSLLIGEPPVYESASFDKPRPPVAWRLDLGGKPLGWAVSENISTQATETTEIHSLVHFDGRRLEQLLPLAVRASLLVGGQFAGPSEMEVESSMLINNPLKQVQHFSTKLRTHPGTGQSLVYITGDVDGDKLKLSFRIGEMALENMEVSMPEYKIRDSFSPEMELRGLHLGQTWTIDTYSPLALASHPMDMLRKRPPTEVLLATVEDRVPLVWNGKLQSTWLVVYRTDASQGPGSEKNIRNKLWVRKDGTVVRQEVWLGDERLCFTRMPEKEAAQLLAERKDFQSHQPAGQP